MNSHIRSTNFSQRQIMVVSTNLNSSSFHFLSVILTLLVITANIFRHASLALDISPSSLPAPKRLPSTDETDTAAKLSFLFIQKSPHPSTTPSLLSVHPQSAFPSSFTRQTHSFRCNELLTATTTPAKSSLAFQSFSICTLLNPVLHPCSSYGAIVICNLFPSSFFFLLFMIVSFPIVSSSLLQH